MTDSALRYNGEKESLEQDLLQFHESLLLSVIAKNLNFVGVSYLLDELYSYRNTIFIHQIFFIAKAIVSLVKASKT